MNKLVRNAILAASLLAGFSTYSYALGFSTCPPPTPSGIGK